MQYRAQLLNELSCAECFVLKNVGVSIFAKALPFISATFAAQLSDILVKFLLSLIDLIIVRGGGRGEGVFKLYS